MIIVLGSVRVRQGQLEEALRLSLEHVARSRKEAGCISHGVHQDAENPLHLVFVEEWSDRDALSAHFQVPASRAVVKALAALASSRPEMRICEAATIQI